MFLGQVFSSVDVWNKLSKINMRPKLAYQILKYTRLVSAEHEVAEKQRVALIHEITNTLEGQDARIEPNTPEFAAYVARFNEIMTTKTDLPQLNMDFEEIVNAVDEKEESLTVQDLAILEPFFVSAEVDSSEEFRNDDGTPKLILDAAGETS